MFHEKKGFTLVELSIVILIIGVLVAGITGGSKLLEQAELRGVISDMARYDVALREFKLQYDALAGDFRNAALHFANCTTTNSHCGGNGDGAIELNLGNVSLGVATGDEVVRVFRHLFLAGIIGDAGNILPPALYDDFASHASSGYFPKSKVSGSSYVIATGVGGYGVCYDGTTFYQAPWTAAERVTAIYMFGTNDSAVIAQACNGGIDPAKAFQIDKKIDDASDSGGAITGADTGIVRGIDSRTGSCTTLSAYDIATTGKNCVLGRKLL